MLSTQPPSPALAPTRTPRIAVLVGLHDGATHLAEQLQSYCDQTLQPACVLAADDGSRDDTIARFDRFAAQAPCGIEWDHVPGPGKGSCANYLALLARTDPRTDYTALSDQDDIWLPEKLARAVAMLAPHEDRPALLGTRSWEWYGETDTRRLSRPVPPPYDFRHALVQNYAGGNTMVLNRAALHLVQACLPGLPTPAVHDWFLYQLITGAGGVVLLDETPHLLYRQHRTNQIGANSSWRSKLKRTGDMVRGIYKGWNDANCAALLACQAHLTPEARALLVRFADDRKGHLPARLAMLRDTGLYRKGRANQAMLWAAALLNRL